MKVRKITFNADKTECWIVLDSKSNGEYIGTLHTRNKDIVDYFNKMKIKSLTMNVDEVKNESNK